MLSLRQSFTKVFDHHDPDRARTILLSAALVLIVLVGILAWWLEVLGFSF